MPSKNKNTRNYKKGAASRRKGRNGELEAARRLGGERTSQTGLPGPDVIDREGRGFEVKRRKDSFQQLYDFLDQTDGVDRAIIRDDRKPWIVMMYLETYEQERGWDEPRMPSDN